MRKILKFASLFVIAISILFGFANVVQAEEDPCEGIAGCRISKTRGNKAILVRQGIHNGKAQQTFRALNQATPMNRTAVSVSYESINVKAVFDDVDKSTALFDYFYDSDYSIAMFCLDAGFSGSSLNYADRFLLHTYSRGKTQAMDHALMAILTSGSITNTSASDAFAKQLAIRAILIAFGNSKGTGNSSYYAAIGTLNRWLDDVTVSSIYGNVGYSLTSQSTLKTYSDYYFEGSAVDSAKSYFVTGLAAAQAYAASEDVTVGIKDVESDPVKKEEVKDYNGTLVKVDVHHKLEVKGFDKQDEKASIKITGLDYAEGKEYEGILKFYISEIKVGNNTLTFNSKEQSEAALYDKNWLKDLFPNVDFKQKVDVYITVHIEGYKSLNNGINIEKLKCGQQPFEYAINGTYKTSVSGAFGDYLGIVWWPNTSAEQRFISAEEAVPTDEKWSSPKKVELIEACDCQSLVDACVATRNRYSDECRDLWNSDCGECFILDAQCKLGLGQNYCKSYDEKCSTCNTQYTQIGACCDESGDLAISTADDINYEIHGNIEDQIKACFVSRVDQGKQPRDEKNNSYQMKTDHSVAQNQFCKVNCREDYVMQLPTARRVNAGRYFTFKVSITNAKKQCFTNTIDRDLYKKQVKELLIAIETSFNTYQDFYKAYQNAKPNRDITLYTSCGIDYSSTEACRYTYNQFTVTIANGGYTQAYRYNKVNLQGILDNDRIDLSKGALKVQSVSGYHSMTSSVLYETCTHTIKDANGNEVPCYDYYADYWDEVTFAEFQDYLYDTYTAAYNSYFAAKDQLEALIKEYNACSGWQTDFNLDFEVNYDYQETYRDLVNMPIEMEGSMSPASTNYAYCNYDWKKKIRNGNTVLTSVNENYTQCDGSGFGGKDLETVKYVKCDMVPDGTCQIEEKQVSKAIYVKSQSESSGEYKPQSLFYNIYPSGEISVFDGDNHVLLEEKLPVSLSTRLGIYEYYVNITNIGEYYDTGELGRFAGNKNSAIIGDSIDYVCAYLVNIPEQNFVCDNGNIPTCEGKDCISTCIGAGCNDLVCDGNNCIADCVGVGCIYDDDSGTSLIEKTVSLNNLFPNGTNSYNWNSENNEKAKVTVSDIEQKGNTVYDETPILSITLDSGTARAIKAYNDSVEDDGGYSNATLDCYSLGGNPEIACYSTFITDLIEGDYGRNVVSDESLIADTSYRTVYDDNTQYFTLWGAVSEAGMLGPSWK